MLVIEDLFNHVKEANGSGNLPVVKKAFEYAQKAHEGQTRKSGEPYIIHPVAVANIIADLRLDAASVAAALLHDVVEDCAVTLDQIKSEFGNEIALLVDGVTKLSKISKKQELNDPERRLAKENEHFENLRRIFLAMAKDIRVIIIKLADRLHNLRTLCNLSRDRQKFIALETLEIFAPLAHRLGIWQIKGELEDLAFSYLEPEEYQELSKVVTQHWVEREQDIQVVIESLSKKLQNSGIKCHIEGRPKHIYSTWLKMKKKVKKLEDIHDLMAVRVLVNTVEDCYATLGIVHSLWMPLHDRIKDYIAKPKSNNYQSLHSTVLGPGGHPLEIQIRTWEMHRVAEFGVAAHWHYKQVTKDKSFDKMLAPWMSQLMEWQSEMKTAKEYVKAFKVDFLENQVFVFTPKGDVIDLPNGSTPLDLAYRIHTDVGHQCIGAKVDGRMVPLDYTLQNGDIVEVLTNKMSSGPSWDWLKICKTSSAKHRIRIWFKKEKREENILHGKEVLEKFLTRTRTEPLFHNQTKEAIIDLLAKKSNFTRLVDFLEGIGCGDINLQTLLSRIREEAGEASEVAPVKKPKRKPKSLNQAVLVKGVDQILVRFSKCCNPLPGDNIVGYITIGKGVSVHQDGCPNVRALLKGGSERIIDVEWNPEVIEGSYVTEIEVIATDKPGLLGEVLDKLYSESMEARSCQASTKREQASIRISVEVPNLSKLRQIIKRIQEIKEVIEVRRVARIG